MPLPSPPPPRPAASDRDGLVMDAPPLGDSLAFDPLLSSVKFIAAPSDEALLPR